MKTRCYNKNCKYYHNYGGRGIKVCDEWLHDFQAFYEYIGDKPTSKHSLDRIDNNGNYEPGNVRWSTYHEQNLNQRIRKDNSIGIKGISYNKQKKKYVVQTLVNSKLIYAGSFDKLNDAIKIRMLENIKYNRLMV